MTRLLLVRPEATASDDAPASDHQNRFIDGRLPFQYTDDCELGFAPTFLTRRVFDGHKCHRKIDISGEPGDRQQSGRSRRNRFNLLDEPEAALSPHSRLGFLYLVKRAVDEGSQFIIATHSPIIASFPSAQILSFDQPRIETITYDNLESVRLYRQFLQNPSHYLERLFRE